MLPSLSKHKLPDSISLINVAELLFLLEGLYEHTQKKGLECENTSDGKRNHIRH